MNLLDVHRLGWEPRFLLWLHGFSSPFLDRFFLLSRFLGITDVLTGFVIAMILWLWWRRLERPAWGWLFGGMATYFSGWAVKDGVARARPELWPRLIAPHGYSFPSGHAMGTAFVLTMLATTVPELRGRHRMPARVGLALPLLWVGLGRLYLGVHWPTDVLAGWAMGFAIAASATWWVRRG